MVKSEFCAVEYFWGLRQDFTTTGSELYIRRNHKRKSQSSAFLILLLNYSSCLSLPLPHSFTLIYISSSVYSPLSSLSLSLFLSLVHYLSHTHSRLLPLPTLNVPLILVPLLLSPSSYLHLLLPRKREVRKRRNCGREYGIQGD